jgi:PIN domain nuclease of toxin-antitoxin system
MYVSIASAWELAIKINIGKFRLDGGIAEFYKMVEQNGFKWLNVEKDYISTLQNLELLHRDPFDRLLISTAISEKTAIITADANIQRYNVKWLW